MLLDKDGRNTDQRRDAYGIRNHSQKGILSSSGQWMDVLGRHRMFENDKAGEVKDIVEQDF